MLKTCDCKSKYQDEKHGSSKRVHNEMRPVNNVTRLRCTVCGKES